ncbi:MAG TPA: DinB family protein [Ktedonobacteraceae bacterium]|nr:DinB family protein [Ktedonobacteraceae bacterium]
MRTELEEARSDFLALLVSLSETDLQQKSVTSAWTVKEVLVHIVF